MKNISKFILVAICCALGFSSFAQHDNLYIIGGPFNANKPNWMFRDVVELEKDPNSSYIFYYNGYIGYNTFGDEPGNFKILISKDSWGGYHPVGTSNQPIGPSLVGQLLNIREGGDDTKWQLPEDGSANGYYSIKVDTQNKTFLIESFTASNSVKNVQVGLFAVGGPFIVDNLNWDPPVESVKLQRDGTNPDVFHYRGYMERNQWGNDPGHFKILVNARSWDESYHPSLIDDIPLNASTPVGVETPIYFNREDAGDKKWYLPQDGSGNGYWDYTLDLVNKTFKVNEFIPDVDYFENIFISGDAMPCGWTESNPEIMTKKERGIYTWTGDVTAGQFKFLKRKEWFGGAYVANTQNETVALGATKNVKYEKNYSKHNSGTDYPFIISTADAGKRVTITLNLNLNTMLIEQDATNVGLVENRKLNVFTFNQRVVMNGVDGDNYIVNITNIDGRQLLRKDFVGRTEVELPQGCYIIVINDKSGHVSTSKVIM